MIKRVITNTCNTIGDSNASKTLTAIERISAKERQYVEEVLNTGFRNSAGYQMTKRLENAFAEKFDLEMVRNSNIEDLRHCLRTGGVAGILVSGDHDDYHGVFSDRWMHWMVVVSEERDGRFCVLDPAYEEGIYEKGDRKGKVEVISRGFSRTTAQVLQEETATVKDGGFCLFWRK